MDDDRDPLGELRRLLTLRRAYEAVDRGTDHARAFRLPEALAELDGAMAGAPEDEQVAFMRVMALAGNARLQEARAEMDRIREVDPRWADYLRRIAEAGLFPNDPAVLDAIAP